MIEGKRILVTGATGQMATPIARDLASRNEVWVAARFSDPGLKERTEAGGMKTFAWSLGSSDFEGLPSDFDYVIHAACNIWPVGDDYEAAIQTNAEGTGLLMAHCRNAEAFLYISSSAVYKMPDDHRELCDELTSPLGCHPPWSPSYSIAKIAAEAVARTLARVYDLPTTIARLHSCYGGSGHGGMPNLMMKELLSGQPVYVPSKAQYNSLIHEDDIIAQVEPMLKAASVPALIVNWCGDEEDIVGYRESLEFLAQAAQIEPEFVVKDGAGYEGSGIGNPARRRSITGPNKVHWKEGFLRAVRDYFPDRIFADIE
jgi:UDP-glucuronate 4-epimerase